jgi:urease accessory protein
MTLAHVVARRENDATVLPHTRARSPVRLLRPTFPGSRAGAVCLVTYGGGLVDGDVVDVALEVEPGAVLVVFTQASTKVFRGASRQSIRADVQGTLVLVPDPVACFAGARYTQRIDVDLRGAGACVVLDGYTSGRPAYGERWAFDGLDMRTTITQDGRVVVRDALRLDVADGPIAPRAGRFEAFATALAIGGAGVEPVGRSILASALVTPEAVVAPSPLPGGAIARIAAVSPARALTEARRALRNLPDIDGVDPWASRS